MTSRDDLRQALTDAGRVPVEPVDERMAGLEQRLLRSIADDDTIAPLVPSGEPDPVRSRRGRRFLAAAASVVLLSIGVLAIRSDDDGLVIAAADGVEVVLPDGSTIDGVAGVELPDGARVDVLGSIVVDGRRYRSGVYRVDDGELVRLPTPTSTQSSTTVATSPTTTESPAAPSRTIEPPPDTAPTRTTAPSTTAPARPLTTSPSTDPVRTTASEAVPSSQPVRTTAPETVSSSEPLRTTTVPTTEPQRETTGPATTRPPSRPTTTTPR